MKDEKRYPVLEEEDSVGMVSEPVSGYAATGSGYVATMDDTTESEEYSSPANFGFYTEDPEVFEKRVAEIETDIDEVEADIEDPDKWITSEQMWAELRQKHPWLR